MKKEFSFKYGDNAVSFSTEKSAVYELERGVTVEVVAKDYTEYDATEWVLYFENKNGSNSKIISDILDSDTVLPLVFPPVPATGYMPYGEEMVLISAAVQAKV